MSEKRRTWASIARSTSFQSELDDSDDERRILSRAILDRRQRIGECEEATRHVATRYSRKIGIRQANRAQAVSARVNRIIWRTSAIESR